MGAAPLPFARVPPKSPRWFGVRQIAAAFLPREIVRGDFDEMVLGYFDVVAASLPRHMAA